MTRIELLRKAAERLSTLDEKVSKITVSKGEPDRVSLEGATLRVSVTLSSATPSAMTTEKSTCAISAVL